MTAQSLKDRVAKRLKATGQPKRRRRTATASRSGASPSRKAMCSADRHCTGRNTVSAQSSSWDRAIRSRHWLGIWGYRRTRCTSGWRVPGLLRRHKQGPRGACCSARNETLTTSQGVGVTAAIFALKNADPDEWQDRYNTESTVNVRVERIPDHELMRIASTARAPLLIEGEVNPDLGTKLGTDRKRE